MTQEEALRARRQKAWKEVREAHAKEDKQKVSEKDERLSVAGERNKGILAGRAEAMKDYFGYGAPREGERKGRSSPGILSAASVVKKFRTENPVVGVATNYGVEIPGGQMPGVEVKAKKGRARSAAARRLSSQMGGKP
jgi:hypothetical protein